MTLNMRQTILFLLVLVAHVALTRGECEGSSCNPQLGDLMVGRAAQLSASSTCGLGGPQPYCIIGYLEDEQKCFTCDSRQPYSLVTNPSSHQIENVITTFEPQRRMKWWQSENGIQEVSIQMNLETIFQFSHLVLTFKSFRPVAMLVERSKDYGRTWKVFRYFAEDCAASFPWVSAQLPDSVDDVVCDGRYSGSQPSTDGEVVLKALDPSFDIEDPYAPHIQELITMTNLRVNFTRLFTLGDTLLGRKRRNPQDKYYYALYDMVVRGSCFCNSHASLCMPVDSTRGDVFNEPGMVHGRCVCEHNTVGANCERCQDFHNDAPWRPGGQNGPNVCQRCNCHGHSESCYFDAARYQATGGVSGGVCEDCRHDRVGPQCEQCRPYLYQDPQRSVEDPQGCIPCDCDPAGSLDGGLCDPVSGRCVCKENVNGERCDRCQYGFYGLNQEDPSGCQRCQCNFLGSVLTPHPCDQETGRCVCQQLATGALCDQCVSGHWGLGNTVYSCTPCNCDIGGAYSSICSSVDGQCQCLPNMVGQSCSDPAPGHFLAPLDYFLFEAENAAPLEDHTSSSLLNPTGLPKCEQYYRDQGYDFKISNGRIVLVRRTKRRARRRRQERRSIPLDPGSALQIVPRQRTADAPITWTGPGFVRVLDGAGLRFTVDNLPASLDYQLVIRYEPESLDDWVASVSILPLSPGDSGCTNDPTGTKTLSLPGVARVAIIDTPVCLNNGGRYYIDITFAKQPNSDPHSSSHILVDSMGLVPKMASVQDFCSQSDLDSFRHLRCVELSAGAQQLTLPEVCEGLIGSLSARIHNGAMVCRCNHQGSLGPYCSKFGGVCDCKANVIGRCCDSCAPLTFGFGPEGCRPCECDTQGSVSELCDQVRGQCPCRREVSGRRCDRCQPGYYGFPLCRPCECNGQAELCHPDTGACLDCREHTTGDNCERCVEGYYGDPVSREPCEPCLCPDTEASGRHFASSCSKNPESRSLTCDCLPGHTGSRCDSCIPGFYGDLERPNAICQECPCNNNIDPEDISACDAVTGECMHCLHNTQGPRCQSCKPGYYGSAVDQDCKECSCDPRGTEVTQCPLGSPCFCDSETGQCPCRTGAMGELCDECADGYWNIQGASGCQPCKCDPGNSLNNICDKVSGQCQCRAEFGGRQCDECGENHFGNPDLQCVSCDCNMEGTERPACDPFTGECLCRIGVAGIFCDECAPGYDSVFPSCAPCHPCVALWQDDVTDVHRAAQRMRTLIPRPGVHQQPAGTKRMLQMHSSLESLANLTGRAMPQVQKVEKLIQMIKKLKDTIDPNAIIIDPTRLLDTQVDNIRHEFKKLMDHLRDKLTTDPEVNPEELEEALDEIMKLHKEYMADEKRVKAADKALEDSMDTRLKIKEKLSSCNRSGNMGPLENKVKALSVAGLNGKICGEPGDMECSKSECGGALCRDALGLRECGGPTCKGSVPVSANATEMAEQVENDIVNILHKLRDSKTKLNTAKQMTQDTQDEAEKLKKKISDTKEKFEKEKNDTKDLIRRVKNYLTDDMVAPEDIENLAEAVLAIQLPGTPDEIRDMIQNIRDKLSKVKNFQENLEQLEGQAKTAKELLEKALEIKNRTKNIDVKDIKKAIYDAENAQDKAAKDLEDAKDSKNMTQTQITEIETKLNETEAKLNTARLQDLPEEIEALKKKMEMNREQAKEAKRAADKALADAKDAETGVQEVEDLFKELKEKNTNQDLEDIASTRLKNITMEAEKLRKDVADKMQNIEDLEGKILNFIKSKEDKANEVSMLLETVETLRKAIASRIDNYITCL
ncbi:laminin subunit beta-4 [Osmerus mordax]|uniref:laminin subunit beta-4 n=1 Tax=Osmerus mordax TaxID=8014 RepID=UPI003510C53D